MAAGSVVTYGFGSHSTASLIPTLGFFVGGLWTIIPAGSEVWTILTAGSETWSPISEGSEIWTVIEQDQP